MEVPISASSDAQPLFKKRTAKRPTIRKRPAIPSPQASSSSEYSSSEDEAGRQIKRQKKSSVLYASSILAHKPSTELSAPTSTADRTAMIDSTNDATKQSNWYDPSLTSLDPKSLLGTTRVIPQSVASKSADDGNYNGASSYQSFIQKNPNAPTRTVGPIKAPTNIRTITVTDFAPDVCKDYKQTGFCGFGDSCKFLHAREDYKQGWELDKDWEIGTKGKRIKGRTVSTRTEGQDNEDGDEHEDAKLEGIPFACIICKGPYKNPIITKCGHYFCENCALQRYRKKPDCAACGAGTGGVFNGAKSLKKLLDKKRERAKQRREKAKENGEEISTEDDDEQEV